MEVLVHYFIEVILSDANVSGSTQLKLHLCKNTTSYTFNSEYFLYRYSKRQCLSLHDVLPNFYLPGLCYSSSFICLLFPRLTEYHNVFENMQSWLKDFSYQEKLSFAFIWVLFCWRNHLRFLGKLCLYYVYFLYWVI